MTASDAPVQFRFGQGLVGQCAREKQRILVRDVPDDYIRIKSSLGCGRSHHHRGAAGAV